MLGYEQTEIELPEYARKNKLRKSQLKNKTKFVKYLWSLEKYAKFIISALILLFMVSSLHFRILNIMSITKICKIYFPKILLSISSNALSVLYRIHIKLKVFPDDIKAQVLAGDVLSSVFNTIAIMFLNFVSE